VQRYKIPEGIRIQVGTVGPQKYKGKIYIQTKCLKLSDEALFKNFKNERLNGSDKIV